LFLGKKNGMNAPAMPSLEKLIMSNLLYIMKFILLLMESTMRLFERGNFGLVGKNMRRYLATTALTATGLVLAASSAMADNWTDHTATEGSISIDTSIPNTTNITQETDFVKVNGDGDINAGWTVNLAQPSSSSKYVLYDIENDPTEIMGTLNANGRVYIFDKNGVLFGKDSVVNVGSIIASTGTVADEQIKLGTPHTFENVGTEGAIINEGHITVAEAGVAAFVAPSVINRGLIEAKVGKVITAAAEQVTVDLYGDNLLEIALDGALEKAVVKNEGIIKAEGGTVIMTASAAKNVVNNVINMDGIVDVSSVSMKGGKIILNGGSKGTVNVAGKMDASGTEGGSVEVKGERIIATGETKANGGDGSVKFVGNESLYFAGNIAANNGFVETSGARLGVHGAVNVGEEGEWLLDPTNINVVAGTGEGADFNPDDSANDSSYNIGVDFINGALNAGSNVTLSTNIAGNKTGRITVGADIQKTAGGDATLRLEAHDDVIVIGDIISSAGKLAVQFLAGAFEGGTPSDPDNDVQVSGNIQTNGGDFFAEADDDVIFREGALLETAGGNVLMNTLGLHNGSHVLLEQDSKILSGGGDVTANTQFFTLRDAGSEVDAGDGDILINNSDVFSANAESLTTSGNITLNQKEGGSIQNAIDALNNTGNGTNTVNVGAGTFFESVLVDEANTVLNGANAGVNPNTAARGAETIVDPNSPGFHVTADNVTTDGFEVTGADDGILVENAKNVTIRNNIIHDVLNNGIKFLLGRDNAATDNRIYSTGLDGDALTDGHGIFVHGGRDTNATGNYIGQDGAVHGNGIFYKNTARGFITGNVITNTQGEGTDNASGIYLSTAVDGTVSDNVITDAKWDGIKVAAGNGNLVSGNDVTGSTRVGIYAESTKNLDIVGNTVDGGGIAGIKAFVAQFLNIGGNTVDNTGGHAIHILGVRDSVITDNDIGLNGPISGNGIFAYNSVRGAISENEISNTQGTGPDNASGIYLKSSTDFLVNDNTISNAKWDGIKIAAGNRNTISDNDITHSTRVGIYGESTKNLNIFGNTIDDSIIAGIKVITSQNLNIGGNTVTDTDDDGITVRDSFGDILITDNVVGKEDGSSFIEGNGISLYNINGAGIFRNKVYNTKTVEQDHASGIYLKKSYFINVGSVGNGNFIRNADWDGIKVADGAHNFVVGNDIADSTRVGVYGVATNDLLIANNTINNSNVTAGIGFEYGRNVKIDNNDVTDSVNNGIYVNGSKGTIRIVNNDVKDSSDDGIEVVDSSAFTYIAGNTVDNSGFGPDADFFGGDGIHVRNVTQSDLEPIAEGGDVGNGEYNIVIYDNTVTNSADDGIEVVGSEGFIFPFAKSGLFYDATTGRVLVSGNNVTNSGYGFGGNYGGQDGYGGDGIHVRGIYNDGYIYASAGSVGGDFYGYAVDVLNNTVTNSGDDGIEVLDSSSTLIRGNTIINSGLLDDGTGDETGDFFGADGIHVRNVWNDSYDYDDGDDEGEGEYETYASKSVLPGYIGDGGFVPYSVVVYDNNVTNSQDDGVQVLFSGDTLVELNDILNSGTDSGSRIFGGDGINVVTSPGFFSYGYGKSLFGYGDVPEVTVNVIGNTVENSLDDGIEVVGANNVLVDSNIVTNSGDDGINILGFAGFGEDEEEIPSFGSKVTLLSYFDWPSFNAEVVNNTVTNSGGDGIESRGFDNLLVDGNTTENSGANGLYVSGFNNGYTTVSGNSFIDGDIGAQFESGIVDLTGESNTITGGRVGLRFAPYAFGDGSTGGDGGSLVAFSLPTSIYDFLFPYPFSVPTSGFAPLSLVDNDGGPNSPSFPVTPPTNYGGTIGSQTFTGQSQYYVELANGAFFAPGTPTWLNGLNSSYDGLRPADDADGFLDPADFDNLESKFFHFVDQGDLGLFFFGLRGDETAALPDIDESDIFNQFEAFNGDVTGLNVVITGLPNIPGGQGGFNAARFNNINTFAGGNGNNPPGNLNEIETAAGEGEGNQQGQNQNQNQNNQNQSNLNEIETAAGNNSQRCWSNAVAQAGGGQVVNVTYGGSFADNLQQAADCGAGF
jgi:filamentous hemagglutinin family protein